MCRFQFYFFRIEGISKMHLTTDHVWIIVLAAIAAVAIVGWFWHLEAWKVAERRRFRKLGDLLKSFGFVETGTVCTDIADGDLAGAVKELEFLARQLSNPETATALLAAVSVRTMPAVLADANTARKLLKVIADWAAANPAAIKADGYALTSLTAPAA